MLRLLGSPQASSDVWFAAACVEIDVPVSRVPLQDFIDSNLKVNGDFDFFGEPHGMWLRARISGAFGYRPLQIANEKAVLLDHGFVAVTLSRTGRASGIPFACHDFGGCAPDLVFSKRGPKRDRQLEIAAAFCDMLKQTEPCPFVAEGIEWEIIDPQDGEEIGTTYVNVGLDGETYYNSDLEYPQGSWLSPDHEPTFHNVLHPSGKVRKCI
jgi:hypothetical protein